MALRISNKDNLNKIRKIDPRDGARIYAKLSREIAQAGILDRDYLHYFLLSLLDLGGFFFFVYQFIVQSQILILILCIVGISFFSVRLGGLIHDAGHRAIFKSNKLNDLYGFFCSFFLGFPFAVWQTKHNLHHGHTNEEGSDPDLEVPISFTPEMLNRKSLVVRLIRKYQAWLLYPLGALVVYTMRLKALKFYLENFNFYYFKAMLFQLCGMFIFYVSPFFIFPFWKALLFLLLTNEMTGFYMLNVFAPNHKGMPQFEKGVKISFLEHQILAARNLYGHWLTDYVYLGLNYQIEHHLFPHCPRHKLKLITPYILEICRRYNLAYTQMSVMESNRFILSELHRASKMIPKKTCFPPVR